MPPNSPPVAGVEVLLLDPNRVVEAAGVVAPNPPEVPNVFVPVLPKPPGLVVALIVNYKRMLL